MKRVLGHPRGAEVPQTLLSLLSYLLSSFRPFKEKKKSFYDNLHHSLYLGNEEALTQEEEEEAASEAVEESGSSSVPASRTLNLSFHSSLRLSR